MTILTMTRGRFVSRLGLFLLISAAIALLFPNTERFTYEYQRGNVWEYEDFEAPFDFPLHKKESIIRDEREAVKAENIPVFRQDEKISFAVHEELEEALNNQTEISKEERKELSALGQNILDTLYRQGIIGDGQKGTILLLNAEQIASERSAGDFFTLTGAGRYIDTTLEFRSAGKEKLLKPILYKILQPDIRYDKNKTDALLKEKLNNVSVTEGLIAKGTLIISRGETISDEKYNILESLRIEYPIRTDNTQSLWVQISARILFCFFILMFLFFFLLFFRHSVLLAPNKVAAVLISVLLVIGLAGLVSRYPGMDFFLVPYCILAILMRSFFDTRLALFAHLVCIMIVGFFAPNGYEFVLIQFAGGLTAIFSFVSLRRRSQMFYSVGIILVVYIGVYLTYLLVRDGDFEEFSAQRIGSFALSCGLTLFVYPLLFLMENTFRLSSDISLMELSDTNHPLLRELAQKAPGTFQHSLQVANLAEAAAEKTDGNALLVRTGALYHDIGKMNAPQYFIENMSGSRNPHESLRFEESAEVIIRHVSDGLEMARKYQLPRSITDFIATHHGTTKVKYFYRHYLQNLEGTPEEDKFTYPGPIPFSKEMAILMMADSVEAASRSLKEYTPESLSELVDRIIATQIAENQFDNAEIHFRDITRIREVFKQKLNTIYHVRIEYPQ